MKNKTKQSEKLYFLQDLLMGNKAVYSGHEGTGKKFKMYQSDYGKYAMNPATREECEKLIKKIEKDAKENCKFQWNIIPITEIQLCNFYSDAEYDAFEKLQKEQSTLIQVQPAGHKYDFWKENKTDQHFELNSIHLRERFLEFLKKKDIAWINYYRSERLIRFFITDKDGLNSVFEESQFETMYEELKPEIVNYEKSLSEKTI